MSINSNHANIILAIGLLLPTASDLEIKHPPTEVTEAVDDASKNRDRKPEITALSQEENSKTKTFSDLDALVKYMQNKKIDFASLHTLIDYVIKNRDGEGKLEYHPFYNKDPLLQEMLNVNIAGSKIQFEEDGIDSNKLASMISQLFEEEKPRDQFTSLSINQKASVTAILAQSKGGVIDEEFLCAIERLKDIPLKENSK
jgi:hypothetical protein